MNISEVIKAGRLAAFTKDSSFTDVTLSYTSRTNVKRVTDPPLQAISLPLWISYIFRAKQL